MQCIDARVRARSPGTASDGSSPEVALWTLIVAGAVGRPRFQRPCFDLKQRSHVALAAVHDGRGTGDHPECHLAVLAGGFGESPSSLSLQPAASIPRARRRLLPLHFLLRRIDHTSILAVLGIAMPIDFLIRGRALVRIARERTIRFAEM